MSQAIFLQWALTVRCFLEFWCYFYEWMDPSKRQRERNRGQRTWQLASLIQLLGGFYLWRTGTASGSHCSRVLWRTAPTHPTHFFFHKREPSWCLHTMMLSHCLSAEALMLRWTESPWAEQEERPIVATEICICNFWHQQRQTYDIHTTIFSEF